MPGFFYDHPVTGKLYYHAMAGGGSGGDQTSALDVPATDHHTLVYRLEHERYLAGDQSPNLRPDDYANLLWVAKKRIAHLESELIAANESLARLRDGLKT